MQYGLWIRFNGFAIRDFKNTQAWLDFDDQSPIMQKAR